MALGNLFNNKNSFLSQIMKTPERKSWNEENDPWANVKRNPYEQPVDTQNTTLDPNNLPEGVTMIDPNQKLGQVYSPVQNRRESNTTNPYNFIMNVDESGNPVSQNSSFVNTESETEGWYPGKNIKKFGGLFGSIKDKFTTDRSPIELEKPEVRDIPEEFLSERNMPGRLDRPDMSSFYNQAPKEWHTVPSGSTDTYADVEFVDGMLDPMNPNQILGKDASFLDASNIANGNITIDNSNLGNQNQFETVSKNNKIIQDLRSGEGGLMNYDNINLFNDQYNNKNNSLQSNGGMGSYGDNFIMNVDESGNPQNDAYNKNNNVGRDNAYNQFMTGDDELTSLAGDIDTSNLTPEGGFKQPFVKSPMDFSGEYEQHQARMNASQDPNSIMNQLNDASQRKFDPSDNQWVQDAWKKKMGGGYGKSPFDTSLPGVLGREGKVAPEFSGQTGESPPVDINNFDMPDTGGSLEDTNKTNFIKHLKDREGFRTDVYKDTEGNLTAGMGHLLPQDTSYKVGDQIGMDQLNQWATDDSTSAYNNAQSQAEEYGQANNPEFVQALGSLNFQLGPGWQKKFPGVNKALMAGDYERAAQEMKYINPDNPDAGTSKFFNQTPVRVNDWLNTMGGMEAY